MLGQIEKKGNNINLAYNHFMIAARAGHKESMNIVKQLFLRSCSHSFSCSAGHFSSLPLASRRRQMLLLLVVQFLMF